MPDDDDYKPAGGALKLKGVQGGKIEKKKKKKKKFKPAEEGEDVVVKKDLGVQEEGNSESGKGKEKAKESPIIVGKTEAEKRFEEMREKRLLEKLKREGIKTHKQRVEEFNSYLSSLSEHHDMPRIGPG